MNKTFKKHKKENKMKKILDLILIISCMIDFLTGIYITLIKQESELKYKKRTRINFLNNLVLILTVNISNI